MKSGLINLKRIIGLIIFFVISCSTAKSTKEFKYPEQYYDVARNFAPLLKQSYASKYDIPTRFDFDGDYIGNNNWENAASYQTFPAYAYFDVKETKTHYFIHYGYFYPRDWLDDCEKPPTLENCHENDYESLLVVVKKDEQDKIITYEVRAHIFLNIYIEDNKIYQNAISKGDKPDNANFRNYVEMYNKTHPVLYAEAHGHGRYGSLQDMLEKNEWFENSILKLEVGVSPSYPTGPGNYQYDLLNIYETFWPYKDNTGNGKTFDGPFFDWEYNGNGIKFILPANMDGDISGKNFEADGSSAPWGFEKGDWFLNPAYVIQKRLGLAETEMSTEYIFNPYIQIK